MKRIITYLYEYQNGIKKNNAGFFKLDLLGDECRVQLNLQGNDAGKECGKVCFAVKCRECEEENKLVGIAIGDTTAHPGIDGGSWTVSQREICGSPYSFDDVHGMAVRFPSGKYLASCWEEMPKEEFLRGNFSEWKPQEQPKRSEEEQMQEAEGTAEGQLQEEERNVQETKELHAEELVKASANEQFNGGEQLQESDTEELLQRMDISDIRRLPRKNWHLCSNSFLIHGFFNYHYLVRKDVTENGCEKSYLGVPGTYSKPERAMAMLFGFPGFEEAGNVVAKTGIPATAEGNSESGDRSDWNQRIPEGTFGYWYCPLDL